MSKDSFTISALPDRSLHAHRVQEFWRVKVDATGEQQSFDRLEDAVGWMRMVKNTFMDLGMTFTVTKVNERIFKL